MTSKIRKELKVTAPAWRSIKDLPPPSEDDNDIRCVVAWLDSENPPDVGVEVTNLFLIRQGDFNDERYEGTVWRTLMDAPPFFGERAMNESPSEAPGIAPWAKNYYQQHGYMPGCEPKPVPDWAAEEIRATWRAARDAGGEMAAFRIIERMVDRLGYGRMENNPSLVPSATGGEAETALGGIHLENGQAVANKDGWKPQAGQECVDCARLNPVKDCRPCMGFISKQAASQPQASECQRCRELEGALKDIIKHQKILAPTMHTIIESIAMKALESSPPPPPPPVPVVWLVEENFGEDNGSGVVGVFASEEFAKKWISKQRKQWRFSINKALIDSGETLPPPLVPLRQRVNEQRERMGNTEFVKKWNKLGPAARIPSSIKCLKP